MRPQGIGAPRWRRGPQPKPLRNRRNRRARLETGPTGLAAGGVRPGRAGSPAENGPTEVTPGWKTLDTPKEVKAMNGLLKLSFPTVQSPPGANGRNGPRPRPRHQIHHNHRRAT